MASERRLSGWEMPGEMGGEGLDVSDGVGVGVDGGDVVALAEKIDEVAAGAAASVEDAHAGSDVAAEQLVEEVDVEVAEGLLEDGHSLIVNERVAALRR